MTLVIIGVILLLLGGCGQKKSGGDSPLPNVKVYLEQTDTVVMQGGRRTIGLKIEAPPRLAGDIELFLRGKNGATPPSGISITPTRIEGANFPYYGKITISVSEKTPPGVYDLLLGVSLKEGEYLLSIRIAVRPPGITVTPERNIIAIFSGESTRIGVTIDADGDLSGVVNLELLVGENPVSELTLEPNSFDVDRLPFHATVAIRAASSVQPGKHDLEIRATLHDDDFNNALSGAAPLTVNVVNLDGGQWRAPSVPVNKVRSCNGMFVAVGYYGALLLSPDGENWSSHLIPGGGELIDVSCSQDTIVAVNYRGRVFTASLQDLSSWEKNQLAGIQGVVYGDGVFITYSNSTWYTSEDGREWQEHAMPSRRYLSRVIYAGGGRFMASGSDVEANRGAIFVSSDRGISWDERLVSERIYLGSIAKGPGFYISLGDGNRYALSDNGIDWYVREFMDEAISRSCQMATAGFDLVIACGDLYFSGDGRSWRRYSLPTKISLIENNQGVLLAAPKAGTIYLSTDDGSSWRASGHRFASAAPLDTSDTGQMPDLMAISHGEEVFVAVGRAGTIATSSDGQTWHSQKVTDAPDAPGNWMDVVYSSADKRFVAVGSRGSVAVSLDGYLWDTTFVGSEDTLLSVAAGNDYYVAVGGTTIAVSVDGIAWQTRKLSASAFSSVTFGKGTFVAISSNANKATVYTSSNGSDWTPTELDGPARNVCFDGSRFVALGRGYVYFSPDALHWSAGVKTITSGSDQRVISYMEHVYCEDGLILAASPDAQLEVLASTDGIHWRSLISDHYGMYGVTQHDGKIYITGQLSTILKYVSNP